MTVQEGTTYSIMSQYTIDYFLNMLLNSVVALGANVTFGGPDPAGYKYNVTSGSRVSLNGNVLPGTLPETLNEGQVFWVHVRRDGKRWKTPSVRCTRFG
jgi:hypothetical protein